jgi:hypothetical protein
MLNEASTIMKPQCPPRCQGCRYYHGADKMVCAVHPFGPEHNNCNDYTCDDFAQRAQEPSQQTSTKSGREDYTIRYGIQSFLYKSLLIVCGWSIMASLANSLIPKDHAQTQTGIIPKAPLIKCRGLAPSSYPYCQSGGQIK